MRLLVLNGPNLNMLGKRQPEIYGSATLKDVEALCGDEAASLGCDVVCRQSNQEGDLVNWLHEAREEFDGVVLNAGAFTHTSIALRDAISAIEKPVIEVHVSNVHAREEFRHKSMIAPVCLGGIFGLGVNGYGLALEALVAALKH